MIDKIQDPYAVIFILQWIKENKNKFSPSEDNLKQLILDLYENIDFDSKAKNYVDNWLENNRELFKIPDVKDGEDGVSLVDIYPNPLDKLEVTFELSDGSKKNIKLPTLEKVVKRTSKMSADGTTLIVNTDTNIDLEPQSQLVLADCTGGNIQVKLPDPNICINSNRSYRISITKKDLTTNFITVVPFDGELIINDPTQTVITSEVLNLITDGTNWYYFS